MVLSLFLPTYKKDTLLLSQNIVTLSRDNSTLLASQAVVSGSKITLKKTDSYELPPDQEALAAFIQTTIASFKKYDQLVCVQSSESILFKELELPLTTKEQVALVLEEEIEPHLPFSPADGNTGFIINNRSAEGISTILTATIKKQAADSFYAPFETANIYPDAITTDAECLALFVTSTHSLQDASAHFLRIVVDVQSTNTQLIFVQNGKIRATKTIAQGSSFFITEQQVEGSDKLVRTFDTKKYQEVLEKVLFACDALALRYSQNTSEETLFFMQTYPEYDLKKNLPSLTDRTLEFFLPATVLSSGLFSGIAPEEINWNLFAKHLGNALLTQRTEKILIPAAITQHNVLQKVKAGVSVALMIMAMIASCIFLLGYQQISTLHGVLNAAEGAQLSKLNEKFAPQLAVLNKPSLKRAISTIEEHVHEQQVFWNMFGAKNLNTLEIMYELTELIDRRVFNVDVTRVTITLSEDDHTPRITLEGIFTSKTEAHYSDFGIFEKHLALSKKLMLTKETENNFADNAHGVKFVARFKLRDT